MRLFANRESSVRPWRKKDLEDIRTIAWETWMATYAGIVPEEDMRSFHASYYTHQRLLQLYNSGVVDGWMARADGRNVGYSKTHWDVEKQEFFVTSLYVLPAYQKRGLGKTLLQQGIERAGKLGCDRIWLGVIRDNKPSLEWYRRQKFEFVDSAPFTIGETTVEDLIGYKLIEEQEVLEE